MIRMFTPPQQPMPQDEIVYRFRAKGKSIYMYFNEKPSSSAAVWSYLEKKWIEIYEINSIPLKQFCSGK